MHGQGTTPVLAPEMAEDDSGERTELPTEKRLREAREQGNVPQSRELSTVAVFGSGVLALMAFGPRIGHGAAAWMKSALVPDRTLLERPGELLGHAGLMLLKLAWVMLPLGIVCVLASFVGPVVMGSLRFSAKSLAPNFQRLDPLSGIKRLYGPESLAELTKSLLRVLFVGSAAMLCIWHGFDQLRSLIRQPLETAIGTGVSFTSTLLLATAGALALLAAIDAPYQKWNWLRKLKMTRQQLLDEMKESEGRPEIKNRIRQMQRQLSQRRMMEAVPSADVIVVNPTHYAVALKYDGEKMNAPRVVAKGVDEVAFRIREVGERNRVAIVSAPPLARSLYRESEIGREIPVRLYTAVAQILSYVYQLRAWRNGIAPLPQAPQVDVDEFGDKA